MRDIGRIDKVLKEVGEVWKQVPDLRLGQLLLNVLQDPALYQVEDDQLILRLKEFYKRSEDSN